MQYLVFLLYSLGIHVGNLYIFIGSFYSKKLRLLREGRKESFSRLLEFSKANKNAIWIHSASLGEFEQGRPLIDAIKKRSPESPIILSFFSPSGYEIRKSYKNADLVIYLPADLDSHAKKMIEIAQPAVFIFIKYEFWWNWIRNLTNYGVKTILISGVFRNSDYFFKWPFFVFKDLLKKYDRIFVQDHESEFILNHHGFNNVSIAGDTRIDSVVERSQLSCVPEKLNLLLSKGQKTIVYGSIWMTDMEIVKASVDQFKEDLHIIAPHDVSTQNVNRIKDFLDTSCNLYSDLDYTSKVIIINNIGVLFDIYAMAKYVYIGGGFQNGIHNILEPAVFKKPVFFGPNYKKFNEANLLTDKKACFPVNNGIEMKKKIACLENDPQLYDGIQDVIIEYFEENQGATVKILNHLKPYLGQSV